MPSLGADMEFGTLVQWRVKPGDAVRRGDIVAEVETQKGVFEIDIREDAVVGELLVREGNRVRVGAPMARLAGSLPTVPGAAPAVAGKPGPVPTAPELVRQEDAGTPAPGRHRASPLARRVAAELGVDLAAVSGTGEGGVITRDDVERAAASVTTPTPGAPVPPAAMVQPAAEPPGAGRAPGMREAIGAVMARSKREIPHYYLSEDIELSAAMNWLREANATRPVSDRILPAALLLKGVAVAVRQFPELNGHFTTSGYVAAATVHLGVAITIRGGGLVAPAIHDADCRSVAELMADLADLVGRARGGGLRASEMTDATITVTNLGDVGARTVFGVITPPQVAVVGFGAIDERPWAADGLVGARPVVTASLSADHRVSDGWRGSRFLRELRRVLGHPEEL